MREMLEKIRECDRNRPAVVWTVIDPDLPGEKALLSDGRILWESRENGFFAQNLEQFSGLQETGALELCGRRVFGDCIGTGKRLVVCGGGHVAVPVVRLGKLTGFEVVVIEDRQTFAEHAAAAGADRVIVSSYGEGLQEIEGDEDTYFVVVTRGHRFDLVCTESIARKPHAYLGMIGSRAHGRIVREGLAERGIPREIIDGICTPIGLNISAETPEEIAVAIIAEIIQVKNRRKRIGGYPGDILKALLSAGETEGSSFPEGGRALATIVSRKGSAPREIGTKMVVFENGAIEGTVGGGLAEALVIRKAVSMLHEQAEEPYLLHTDMTNEDAEEEGMVCGGIMDILIEPIL